MQASLPVFLYASRVTSTVPNHSMMLLPDPCATLCPGFVGLLLAQYCCFEMPCAMVTENFIPRSVEKE